jgi:hypothetical protein
VLLGKENMRLTLRLILADAFNKDEKLTTFMHDLFAQCPSLFSSILPNSEHIFSEANEKDDDDDDDAQVVPDAQHTQLTVLGCIQAKYCRDTLSLPTRNIHMTTIFARALAEAYSTTIACPILSHSPAAHSSGAIRFPSLTREYSLYRTFLTF